MDHEQAIIKEAINNAEQRILATIIQVDGSAYRKAGAMALFKENGVQMGMISGGCLEEDLANRAMMLIKEPDLRSLIVRYDMTAEDDLGWGRGAGCNGVVHLLLEKVDAELTKQLAKGSKHLDKGVKVYLTKQITKIKRAIDIRHLGESAELVDVKTSIFPSDGRVHTEITNVLNNESEQTMFKQVITPRPRLVIFGAGIDVHPLATMAYQTGFSVTVWDWRSALLKQSLFPDATLIHAPSAKKAIAQAGITSGDYAVIMTHDFQMDQAILHHVSGIDALSYLGILGPSRRTSRLLHNDRKGPFPYIHSPIGLSIGADGPDEIAISILAELIQIKNGIQKEKRPSIEEQYRRRISSSGK